MTEKIAKLLGFGTPIEKARDKFAKELRKIKDKDKRKELLESKKGQSLKFSWSYEKINQFLASKPKFTLENKKIFETIFKSILEANKQADRFFSVNELIQKLATNPDTKNFLNSDLAKLFVETKNSLILLVNFKNFNDLNFIEIAKLIIENKETNDLFSMLNTRINVSEEDEKYLIELALKAKEYEAIISHFFSLKQRKTINLTEIITAYVGDYKQIDPKVIELGLAYLDTNESSSNTDFLILLIKKGLAEECLRNISKFNIDKYQIQLILEEIIKSGKTKNIKEIFSNYEVSTYSYNNIKLDINFAFELIRQGNTDFVFSYRYIFQNFNENFEQIMSEILKSGNVAQILKYLKELKNLDFKIAEALITNGYSREISEMLSNFNYHNPEAINFILNNILFFEFLPSNTQKNLIIEIDKNITLNEDAKLIIGQSILRNDLIELYFTNQQLLGISQDTMFEIAKKQNKLKIIINYIDKFTQINGANLELLKTASKIFGSNLDVVNLMFTSQLLEDSANKETIIEISNYLIKQNLKTYFDNPEFFKRISPKIIYDQFIKLISEPQKISNSAIIFFIQNINNFPNSDTDAIVEILIKNKYFLAVIFEMENLKIDQNRIFKELLKTQNFNIYLQNKGKFDKLDPKIQNILKIASSIFGEYMTQEAFLLCLKIMEGSVSQNEKNRLGISQSGESGIQQLISKINSFKKEMLQKILIEEDSLIDFLILNPEFLEQFMKYIRYDTAEFGRGEKDKLLEVLIKLKNLEGTNKFTKSEYQRSGEVKIKVADSEKKLEIEFSKEFVSRYLTLKKSISEALEFLNKTELEVYDSILNEFNTIKDLVLEDLNQKLQNTSNPKAVEHLKLRIQNLKEINLPQTFEGNLEIFLSENYESMLMPLSKFQEFYPLLRKIAYFVTLKNSQTETVKMKSLTEQSEIQEKNIEELLGFDDAVQESFKIFKNKYSNDEFRKITSTKAITDEQERIRKFKLEQSEVRTTAFEFIPTRGILMEFSGQIAGACWASKYDSIAKEFPNFTSIIMVQNPGTKFERLAGAYFLIETTSQDGTPLLVIRGLNPIENVINSMDVADFFEKTVSHAKGIANKMGRKLAIVIDNHRGGAATNRGAVYNHLAELAPNLEKIILNTEDTTFNNYNISTNTYLLN